MFYYGDFNFDNRFDILLGVEKNKVIFSHCYQNQKGREKIIEMEKIFFPDLRENQIHLKPIIKTLEIYKDCGPVDPCELDVFYSRGTEFEKRVWQALRKVKKGNVTTYKKLSEMAGYAGAHRAVGNAMGKNYLLLFVPCHRVIKTSNDIGGFGCGVDRKKALLQVENYQKDKKYVQQ